MKRFSDAWLKRLQPDMGQRIDYRDAGRRGLHLRVWPNGTKVFVYVYQRDHKMSVLKLGSYPGTSLAQAYAKYDEAKKLLDDGQDPGPIFEQRREANASAGTVQDLLDEWLTLWAAKERRHKGVPERSMLFNTDNLPASFLKRKAKDVGRREVIELLDKVAERSQSVANDLCSLLKQAWSFAVNRALVPSSPLVGLPPPGGSEKPRERVLSDDELKVFWKTLPKCDMSERVRLALKFMLLTGQRRGETSRMRWPDVDLAKGVWTIPAADSKTGITHAVPLAPQARAILEQLRGISEREKRESEYVFPSQHSQLKKGESMTERAISHAIRDNEETLEKAGIKEPFTPHDLRRTLRTGLSKLKVDVAVAERVIGHQLQGMLRVYDQHDYLDEKRAALIKWAKHIQKVTAEA